MTAQAQVQTFDFSDPNLFNPAYIPLLNNDSEFLHLWGSAGSGKSRFAAQKEIIKSFSPGRRNRKTLVVRKVYRTLKESAYAELKAVIFNWKLDDCFELLKTPLQITNKITNVSFLFVGLDDVEKIKSISGVDRIWIEEATELADAAELSQLRLRLRGFDKVQITLTYNPIDEHHWLNTEIHEEALPGHYLSHSTYRDNTQMLARSPDYARYIESLKDTDSNYYRVYGLGLWGKVVEGLIYPEVQTGVEFPQTLNGVDDIQYYGLDFGFSDPTAMVAVHVQDAYPKRNLICKELLYEPGLDGPALVAWCNENNIRKDVQIVADSARPEMIKSLKDAGYRVRPTIKYDGSVLSGINEVRKYNICIAAGSKNLVKEAHNYAKKKMQGVWLEIPAPRQPDHLMDTVRYVIADWHGTHKPLTEAERREAKLPASLQNVPRIITEQGEQYAERAILARAVALTEVDNRERPAKKNLQKYRPMVPRMLGRGRPRS